MIASSHQPQGNEMQLKLDRAEIEQILLVHINRVMPDGRFNSLEWDGYRSPGGITFQHTDLPPEKEDE